MLFILMCRHNSTTQRNLCTRFSVRGVPSLKMINDGGLYEFSGDRDVEHFVKFAEGGYKAVERKPIPEILKSEL